MVDHILFFHELFFIFQWICLRFKQKYDSVVPAYLPQKCIAAAEGETGCTSKNGCICTGDLTGNSDCMKDYVDPCRTDLSKCPITPEKPFYDGIMCSPDCTQCASRVDSATSQAVVALDGTSNNQVELTVVLNDLCVQFGWPYGCVEHAQKCRKNVQDALIARLAIVEEVCSLPSRQYVAAQFSKEVWYGFNPSALIEAEPTISAWYGLAPDSNKKGVCMGSPRGENNGGKLQTVYRWVLLPSKRIPNPNLAANN